ncbi:transcriptional regulator [Erythrobacter longus]|uniref:Transcriptional regulator n=1 Tax=Erythrobacter longus TaxID=1044 RepID=A0A074M3F4_ERYLO|nr:response regulator transcription factor [Erythrobacter longus]KEO89106.1 transcriptional regulator [Erythrobacter longus]
MRLLLVEDDVELGRRLSDRLRSVDFAVELARSRSEAEDWPDVDQMAAVILDLGLPDGDGIELLRHWRDLRFDTPIVILTARGSWQDKVEGLNAGADDFVVKPVRFEELLARLNALFRRQQGTRSNLIEVGDLALDPLTRAVEQRGQALSLSKQEFKLLHLFMRRAGQVMSQATILDDLYELGSDREPNTIEVLVGRLRRKIGRDRIATLRGMGYRFEK